LGLFSTIGSGNGTSFVSTDRLFVVGNGTNTSARSNALTLLKNGNMVLGGTLTLNSTGTGTATYTFPATRGTNGQIIQTDANGNLSWVNPPSGSADWASPGSIGSTTPNAGAFTGLKIGTGTTTYTFPNARGTNSQIIQTDANGNLSWVNPPSGSADWASPGSIGSTTPNAGAFTGLKVGTGTTTYTFPNARGTNSQIIQTDANGNLSWVNPPSGSADWASPGSIGSTTPNAGAFTGLKVGTGTTTYTFPNARGTNGQIIQTNGTGGLSWVTPSSSPTGSAGGDLTGTYPNPSIANSSVTSAKILDGTITNSDISTSAAITYSKLNLNNSIANSDLASNSVTPSKIDPTGASSGNVITYNGTSVVWAAAGGGGLTNFTESNYTYNSKTGVKLLATNAATNADIVLQPKGNGSILSQQPDGTVTGGNNRGTNAVDLQTSRGNASQVASGNYSFIGGGVYNTASGLMSSVAGGQLNLASGQLSFVGGGDSDTASGSNSFVGGGNKNIASNSYSSVVGGQSNLASGNSSSVVGGQSNLASGGYSFVGGGIKNIANFSYSAVVGGYQNSASGILSFVGGGDSDTASGYGSFVGGGYKNIASGNSSFVGGGSTNLASGVYSAIVGGQFNLASNSWSFVGGGRNDTASGSSSAVIYGAYLNTDSKTGAVMIGDYSTTTSTKATANNQFTARFNGGYRLFSNSGANVGVQVSSGGNSWSSISDSTKKENFKPADEEKVLESFRNFRLGSWNYKDQDKEEFRHYGPMAQEWDAAFGHDGIGKIGCDTLLASADVDGIAYIAIKGLEKRTSEQAQLIKSQSEMIKQLQDEIAKMKKELASAQNLNEAMLDKFVKLTAKLSELLEEKSNVLKTANN
jgi:uncharacterized coiled-coil protein SlyX